MSTLLLILAAFIAVGYIHNTIQARERATAHAIQACEQQNYQFLDGTVFREKTRLSFDKKLRVLREYRFEYSIHGDDRQSGYLTLSGNRLHRIVLKETLPD